MRVGVDLSQLIHGRNRNPPLLGDGDEIGDLPILGPISDQRRYSLDVAATRKTIFEELLVRPLRVTHQRYQAVPLMLFDAAQQNLAVRTVDHATWPQQTAAQARSLNSGVG